MILLVQVRLYGPKQRIAHFHPNWSNGTAGVRGTRVLNGGRFYWEINVSQRIFGTSMMFGIGKNQGSFVLNFDVDLFILLDKTRYFFLIYVYSAGGGISLQVSKSPN